MNRQFKFRVWSIRERMFYYDYPIVLTGGGAKIKLSVTDCGFVLGSVEPCIQEDYVTQQFTGLQDKNGKDIYEGDIIKYPADSAYLDKYDTMVIEWENDGDGFGGLNCGFRMGGDYANRENTEVIGNIFENPELCEK